ncbi:hypothetical protein [Allorhizocola rhizosphaerae]|uniref:hypothetical protein n=1 Tax=Allorhizocola rhizosphaerae TaxID=1872709 RepID=UPI000E3CC0A8|nr:hypothetical protein [Allorhizocola rhizosphaerae]
MKLSASLDGRPILWKVITDDSALKEISLRFEDNEERLPLYPGERALLEYGYFVGVDKWGPWFERSVQCPTRRLLVEIRLPARLAHKVWGTVRDTLAEPEKAIDITRTVDGEFAVFSWKAADPRLFAVVRMRWELTYASGRQAPSGSEPP